MRGAIRLTILAGMLAISAPALAQSQKETLADIRKELSTLSGSMQSLRSELVASAARQPAMAGGSALERMDLLEQQLTRLTARTEELEFRINQVVKDGTNRIGDLEFRVTELEGGDIGAVGTPTPLGGGASSAPAATAAPSAATTGAKPPAGRPATVGGQGAVTQMAVGEQKDFDRAREVLGQGDFRTAADLFATFAQTYTGGPLTGEAHFWRGEALTGQGNTLDAAKAYLESYSGWPNGAKAPEALTKLGTSIGTLGQKADACATLAQVAVRYPDSGAVAEAAASMQSLGCS